MKNLIRGHLYQLKRDNLFFGCLAFSVAFLIVSIRIASLGGGADSSGGIESLMSTFLGGDFVLYAFMLLTANMIAEAYRSGVMKNIIGRGIPKKQYYLSVVVTVSAAFLLVMLLSGIVMGVLAGSRSDLGTISYPAFYALSVIARILFVMAHISFAVTMAILTRNAIAGVIFGLMVPNIPQILEMILRFLKIRVDLGFLKISTHTPSIYEASNDLSTFLPCLIVLCGYLAVSIFVGLRLLKYQDIK